MKPALSLIAAGLLATGAPAADALYPNPVHATANAPWASSAADFDQDGHLDLVTGSEDGFILLFGNGDGRFRSPVLLDTFVEYDVVAADFNGDGFEDLAGPGDGQVSVLLGNGDGTFGPETEYPTNLFLGVSLIAADFDNDDNLDLVSGTFSSLWILLGDGDGTFSPGSMISPGPGTFYPAAADFNQDANLDVTYFGNDDTLRLRLGNGDGTFGAASSFPVGLSPGFAAAGDFNGDDRPDLAVANSFSNDVSILLGDPVQTFLPEIRYAVGGGPWRMQAADLDADTHQDLIVSNLGDTFLSVLPGNGDGTFAPEVRYETASTGGSTVLGDFDGDGVDDLAVVSRNFDHAFVLPGRGDGTFVPRTPLPTFPVGGHGVTGLGVGDFDQDGHADLVTSNDTTGDVSVLAGVGNGSFLASVEHTSGVCSAEFLVVGSFNADAVPDVAVLDVDLPGICVLAGAGDGTLSFASVRQTQPTAIDLLAVDLDGNGADDVVVLHGDSIGPDDENVAVFLSDGDARFVPTGSVAVGPNAWSLAAADLDGDQNPDLLTANVSSDDISILFGNGDGTFAPEVRQATGTAPRTVLVADLDGNETLDLIVQSRIATPVLLGQGDGTFLPGPMAPVVDGHGFSTFNDGAGTMFAGDFDGDGILDVVQTWDGDVGVFQGRGDATFEDPEYYATTLEDVPFYDLSSVASDLDGNGALDLAIAGVDRVTAVLNQTSTQIRFEADKTTLSWTLLFGADSYNVYRGTLADLVDTDDDGLPDAGYGTCQNAFDPDLSDNTFADPAAPGPDEGFFYLRSRVGAQGETDLGTTRSGLSRFVVVPCP